MKEKKVSDEIIPTENEEPTKEPEGPKAVKGTIRDPNTGRLVSSEAEFQKVKEN